jgi:N-glycosidase YbiA
MAIRFYSSPGRYGFLSNFSPHGFALDGADWPTSEHYYQAQKFEDPEVREQIRLAPGPAAAKSMGRGKQVPIRSDWDAVREAVMRQALVAKFAAHPELAAELVATGDEALIEDSRTDYYWGCGADGSGANRLGVLLMELRTELVAGQRARGDSDTV